MDGEEARTWCSWLSFLLELPQLTGDQVARLVAALQADGFPVPLFDPTARWKGRAFVLQFLSHNVESETALMAVLLQTMPPEVAALINPGAACAPEHVPVIWPIVPPPLPAPMEQQQNDEHNEEEDDDADGTLADANKFPCRQQHIADTLPPSDAEDDEREQQEEEEEEEEEPQSDRELRSPSPAAQEVDEGKQANEESVLRLSAAADEAAAAAAAGNAQGHAAAAAHTAAPQADAMADIPPTVSLVSSSAAFPSSVAAPSSSVSRITRKRSSPSASEGDEPSAIRRKLSSSSPSSAASSPLPSLSGVSPAVKSGLALAQGVGAAASATGMNDDAACHFRFFGPAALSLSFPQLPPPHAPAVPPTPDELLSAFSLLVAGD
jgi:hypothetical protein